MKLLNRPFNKNLSNKYKMPNRRNVRKNRTRKNARNGNAAQMGGAKKASGSKREVWNGTAKHTPGGLVRSDLMKHKGRIVSKKKHAAGKKAIARLRKLGYTAKKGSFKLFRKGKKRGGFEDLSGGDMSGFEDMSGVEGFRGNIL
jgi:hypothetical protein